MITGYVGRYVLYMGLTALLYVPCRIAWLKRKKVKVQLWREACLLLFWVFTIGVLSQTVFPRVVMGITGSGEFFCDVHYPPKSAPNFVPFKTLWLFLQDKNSADWHSISVVNLVGNFLLFLQIGFFFPFAYPTCTRFWKACGFGLLGILSIEILQYFCGRVADVDDVLLNMLRFLLGYGLFLLCNKVIKRRA